VRRVCECRRCGRLVARHARHTRWVLAKAGSLSTPPRKTHNQKDQSEGCGHQRPAVAMREKRGSKEVSERRDEVQPAGSEEKDRGNSAARHGPDSTSSMTRRRDSLPDTTACSTIHRLTLLLGDRIRTGRASARS
jgi:hypothetical protein